MSAVSQPYADIARRTLLSVLSVRRADRWRTGKDWQPGRRWGIDRLWTAGIMDRARMVAPSPSQPLRRLNTLSAWFRRCRAEAWRDGRGWKKREAIAWGRKTAWRSRLPPIRSPRDWRADG